MPIQRATSHRAADEDRCSATSDPVVSIRVATSADEREAIYRLRHEIYIVESRFRPEGLSDHGAWEEENDAHATHLYAVVGGQIVGAVRISFGADSAFSDALVKAYNLDQFVTITPRERMAIASRFALRREYRAGSVTLQLLIASARVQRERGIELSFGDSPINLLPFYASLGFQTFGTPYHHPVAGTLVPFVLAAGDLHHLRRVGSPLVALANESTPDTDETARRMRELIHERPLLRSARKHAAHFWEAIHEVFGQPPFALGPFAGFTTPDLRSLLAPSIIVDWLGGETLLRKGHPVSERWIVLSGTVEVDGQEVPPFSIIGGASEECGVFHDVNARIADGGARLLSLDERKLRMLLASSSPVAERFKINLPRFQVRSDISRQPKDATC